MANLMHENRKRMDRRLRELEVIKTCAVCQTQYTRKDWESLELHALQTFEDGQHPPQMEYRHCPCRNTMALELDRHGEVIVDDG